MIKRVGRFDFPELDPEMILDIKAPTVWAEEATVGESPYLYTYGTGAQHKVPWDKVVVGYYVEDAKFTGVWNRFDSTLKRFQDRKIVGMITPLFSPYFSYPKATRLWQIYRARYVGAAYQEAGIPIIPDISGHPDDISYMFDGIPKNKPVSLQVYRGLDTYEVKLKNKVIEAMFKRLEPSRVWVYGNEKKAELLPLLKDSRCEWIKPWGDAKIEWKKRKINGISEQS